MCPDVLLPPRRPCRRIVFWLFWSATLCLLAGLSFAGAGGAEPKAVIVGPAKSLPGDLVVLRTEGTVGVGHRWCVIGPAGTDSKWFAAEGGLIVVFASRTEGTYSFVLAVTAENKISQVVHTLANREDTPPPPPPPPNPNPYPPPSPAYRSLVDPVTAALGGSNQPNVKADSVRLALVFHRVGSFVAGGGAANVGALRKAIVEEGAKEFGSSILDRYNAAEAAIEAALRAVIGLKNRPLDEALRKQAADILESLAWACWEASR